MWHIRLKVNALKLDFLLSALALSLSLSLSLIYFCKKDWVMKPEKNMQEEALSTQFENFVENIFARFMITLFFLEHPLYFFLCFYMVPLFT